MIKEIFIIRSVACIAVVLGHAMHTANSNQEITNTLHSIVLMALMFGTPTFVFISELILSKSYRNRNLPKDFLLKRFNLIFIPYIFAGGIYAILESRTDFSKVPINFFQNILGGYHGYFVLIIFQFYILHILFSKYIKGAPTLVISISLIVNVIYLSVFNFIKAPNIPYAEYIWKEGHWLPFLGWIFYFTLAFYCGKYYETYIKFVKNNRFAVALLFFASFSLIIWFQYQDFIIREDSKRVDIILYTISIIFLISAFFRENKSVPFIFLKISQYSFGIYLQHIFYFSVINVSLRVLNIQVPYIPNVLILTIGSIICSIITTYTLNRFRFGKYIVGQVGKAYEPGQSSQHNKLNPTNKIESA